MVKNDPAAMDYKIEAGKPRLFSFKFLPAPSQKELSIWFWDGYLLIAHWFDDADFSDDYYELPEVHEFILRFALFAGEAYHCILDAEFVYAWLRLCEDTHDAILAHYHRPR